MTYVVFSFGNSARFLSVLVVVLTFASIVKSIIWILIDQDYIFICNDILQKLILCTETGSSSGSISCVETS